MSTPSISGSDKPNDPRRAQKPHGYRLSKPILNNITDAAKRRLTLTATSSQIMANFKSKGHSYNVGKRDLSDSLFQRQFFKRAQ